MTTYRPTPVWIHDSGFEGSGVIADFPCVTREQSVTPSTFHRIPIFARISSTSCFPRAPEWDAIFVCPTAHLNTRHREELLLAHLPCCSRRTSAQQARYKGASHTPLRMRKHQMTNATPPPSHLEPRALAYGRTHLLFITLSVPIRMAHGQ